MTDFNCVQQSVTITCQITDFKSVQKSENNRRPVPNDPCLRGLCAPMILGLPFLVHNNIVVDAAARTVVNKKCNFDLLHPIAPALPPPPKQKLREFFNPLQADRKLMVAELNMVCHDRLYHTQFKFEQVKPADIVATIRQRIEVLAAQKELEKLRENIKHKFKDVFSKIPHLDDLPMLWILGFPSLLYYICISYVLQSLLVT